MLLPVAVGAEDIILRLAPLSHNILLPSGRAEVAGVGIAVFSRVEENHVVDCSRVGFLHRDSLHPGGAAASNGNDVEKQAVGALPSGGEVEMENGEIGQNIHDLSGRYFVQIHSHIVRYLHGAAEGHLKVKSSREEIPTVPMVAHLSWWMGDAITGC